MNPDDDTLDLDTSTSPGETQQPAPQAAAPADSPSAPGEKKTVLDVVRDAAPQNRASPADANAKDESPKPGDEQGAEESEEESAAKEAELPYHKDPRFQRIIRQRATYKEQAARYEQDAQRYRNVQTFLDTHGVNAEEAASALQIAALIKTDPHKAWEALKPIAEQLLTQIGGILPPDLVQRVNAGELTEGAARELSKARAAAEVARKQISFDQQLRQTREQQERVSAVQSAAATWEAERRERDPNYAQKVPLLEREILFLQRNEGMPTTPEGVKAQLAKAYRTVNQQFTAAKVASPVAAAPERKPEVKPVRSGGVASDGARPKAKSVLDIVKMAG